MVTNFEPKIEPVTTHPIAPLGDRNDLRSGISSSLFEPEVPPLKTTSRFKTLSSRDPEFQSYLDGSFSSDVRALPIRSMNVDARSAMAPDSTREEVTFELIPVADIPMPNFLKLCWILSRPTTLILSMGPMLVVLTSILFGVDAAFSETIHFQKSNLIWWMALGEFAGVLALQVSVNLFNDYYDHIRGKDRLSAQGGSRAIQNGWITARNAKQAAWCLLGLSVLLGAPAVIVHFSGFIIVAALALLAALEFASQKVGLKYRGFGEIMAFALTGPLLTVGFAWALTGNADSAQAALGGVFGSIALMYYHAANFENIMPDDQAGISTWATRTGFDASKKFFYFTAGLMLVMSVIAMLWIRYDLSVLVVPFLLAIFLTPMTTRVQRLASPLSSDLVGLRHEVIKLSAFTVVVFVIANFLLRA